MRSSVPLALLCALLTTFLTLLCGFAQGEALAAGVSSGSKATGRFYQKRPKAIVLPTGCQLGFGPQYRSFDSTLGKTFKISGDTFVDFYPVSTCAAAAGICSSQLSGTSCCKNACRQQHSGRQVAKVKVKSGVAFFPDGKFDPTGVGAIFDPEGYRQCESKCARVPTVRSKFLTAYPSGTRSRTIRTKR